MLKSALEVVRQMSSLSSGFAIDNEVPIGATTANINSNETFRPEILYILSPGEALLAFHMLVMANVQL